MVVNAKNMIDDELFFGHKACAGCGGSLALRAALKVLGPNAVAALPAGCMSAVGFNFPQLAFANNAMITPFAATASVGYLNDFIRKVERARDIKGTRYIHVIAPCPTGWGCGVDETVDIAKDIVDTGLWYLAEYEGEQVSGQPGGRFRLNRDPKQFASVPDYLRRQGRFRALSDDEVAAVEQGRDAKWEVMRREWRG